MEKIHEGWLTKSPPDWKKHMRLFKLKWRRRYFILYSPPSSCVTPGTCPAQLCYYENETLSKECGKIDLTSCEEVVTQLETDDHDHVMALRTVCKNQTRIYYLAADCEKDLEIWVDRISFVLSLSGEEFIESNQTFDEEEENHVPTNLKLSKKLKSSNSKSKKEKKIRSKTIGVTLIRSSSLLSKSSNCLTQLTSRQNKQPVFCVSGLSLSTPKRVSRSVGPAILEGSTLNSHDSSDSDASSLTSHSSSLFSKHSFLNKIKPTIKSNARRPSCPILIPSPVNFEETNVSAEHDVLRQKIQKSNQPMRFQGSSGSSILSYASDYRTPDLSSPSIHMTPPIFLLPVKKQDTPECISRLSVLSKTMLKSESTTPPPLPPKKKTSDSEPLGEQNEAMTPSMIYDVPAHNYGGYESEEEQFGCPPPKACLAARSLEEFECCNRYEGVCLSVVDEQDDEGLDCDLLTPTQCRKTNYGCDDYTLLPNCQPPPLPMRNTTRKSDGDFTNDDSWRNSNDSSYDVLPFSRKNVTSDTVTLADQNDSDSDNNDDSYDYIPMFRLKPPEPESPPPIPQRSRRFSSDIAIDTYMGRSDLNDSPESLYDHIGVNNSDDNFGNLKKRKELLDDIQTSLELVKTQISEELKLPDKEPFEEDAYATGPSLIMNVQLSQFQSCWDSDNESFVKKHLSRKKSKSLEDIMTHRRGTSEWGAKTDNQGIGDEDEDDVLIRKTFKTKSFKRKSADYKNKFNEFDKDSSTSSLTSTSSATFEEEPKTFIVCDDALY